MRLKPAYREETRVGVDLGFGDVERHGQGLLQACRLGASYSTDGFGNGKGGVLGVALSIVAAADRTGRRKSEIAK